MKKIIFIFILLGSEYGFCSGTKMNLLWKARGLQADERITVINKELKGKKPSKANECELILEDFYKAYTNPNQTKLLYESKGDKEIFKIIFIDSNKKEGRNLTMVDLVYDQKSTFPAIADIVAISESWSVAISTEYPLLAIRGNGCIFSFSLKDPLSGTSRIQQN